MSEADRAKTLWRAVEHAFRGADERKLWLAWKIAYRARFWTHYDAMGPGQVCTKHGVAYDQVLRRLTAYEMRFGRDAAVDEAELIALNTTPSVR